jgi:hypothetical protein
VLTSYDEFTAFMRRSLEEPYISERKYAKYAIQLSGNGVSVDNVPSGLGNNHCTIAPSLTVHAQLRTQERSRAQDESVETSHDH